MELYLPMLKVAHPVGRFRSGELIMDRERPLPENHYLSRRGAWAPQFSYQLPQVFRWTRRFSLTINTFSMTLLRTTCIALSALVLTALLGAGARAQDGTTAPPDTAQWEYNADVGLNASQAGYRNWEEGAGNNSLALATGFFGQAEKRGRRWIQLHELQLDFGVVDQEEQEVRKAEDLIQLNTSLRYDGDGFFNQFNPTIAGTFRSQFAKGFDYTENPFEGQVPDGDPRLDLNEPVQSSEFLSPAFITESIGLTYEPYRDITIRLGAASKQTVVNDPDFRVLYGVDSDKVAEVEGGAELAISANRLLTESIRYRSQFNAFYAVNQTEDPPDARWQNTFNLQVNDWLSTDLEFVALFDNDITDALQLKETISVGLNFSLDG
ncbi:MAG: hypothetical protein BRD55_08470 [Bacteroidetes bacterium SW_9_63_38]|nr:MAG: hypothetical protein BRD55_08470 [Bacteroidetes bacterium SW_9_63_38]